MSFVDNAIDLPWRNFLRPEFGAKFQRNLGSTPIFWDTVNFLNAQSGLGGRKPPCQKQTYPVVSIQYRLVTDGHMMTANMHRVISAQRRAVKMGAMSPFNRAHATSYSTDRNYRSILYRFRDMAYSELFVEKSPNFPSHLHLAPPGGDSGGISSKSSASEN